MGLARLTDDQNILVQQSQLAVVPEGIHQIGGVAELPDVTGAKMQEEPIARQLLRFDDFHLPPQVLMRDPVQLAPHLLWAKQTVAPGQDPRAEASATGIPATKSVLCKVKKAP